MWEGTARQTRPQGLDAWEDATTYEVPSNARQTAKRKDALDCRGSTRLVEGCGKAVPPKENPRPKGTGSGRALTPSGDARAPKIAARLDDH